MKKIYALHPDYPRELVSILESRPISWLTGKFARHFPLETFINSKLYQDTREAQAFDVSAMRGNTLFLALEIAKTSETINKLSIIGTDLQGHGREVAESIAQFPKLKEINLIKTEEKNILDIIKVLLTSKSLSSIILGKVQDEQTRILNLVESHNKSLKEFQEQQKSEMHYLSEVVTLPIVITDLIGEYYVDPIVEVKVEFGLF